MNSQDQLAFALEVLNACRPDPGVWSGPAATAMEARIIELLAELEVIRGNLWL